MFPLDLIHTRDPAGYTRWIWWHAVPELAGDSAEQVREIFESLSKNILIYHVLCYKKNFPTAVVPILKGGVHVLEAKGDPGSADLFVPVGRRNPQDKSKEWLMYKKEINNISTPLGTTLSEFLT